MKRHLLLGNITSIASRRCGSQGFNILVGIGVVAERVYERQSCQSQAGLLAFHIVHQFGQSCGLNVR